MKLKSPNVWFIFGTVPVLVLDFVLGAWFARGMVWLSVVLLLLGLLAAAVPAAVAFGPQLEAVLGSFVLYFAAPFAAVAAFGGCLYLWNRTISIQDKQLDAFLLGYFSKEQVKQYIQVTEKMNAEGGSEKSRVFTEHYRDDRLKALDTNKH